MENYKQLENKFERIHHLEHFLALGFWDQETMMPDGAAPNRANALAELQILKSEILKDTKINDLISASEAEVSQSQWASANLREIKRIQLDQSVLPEAFIKERASAVSASGQAWKKYRSENSWSNYLPYFEKVLEVAKKEAEYKSQSLGVSPYEALINNFEPGFKESDIDSLFIDIKKEVPGLIQLALEKQKSEVYPVFNSKYSVEKQKELGMLIMKHLEFNFSNGRLDVSAHPFCGGVPSDVRITTRYSESEFIQSMMGIIHETGHASYEQNLPAEWSMQPVGLARSMAIHEGQSLFFEMQVGCSKEFSQFLSPHIKRQFNFNDQEMSPELLYKTISKVNPGFIRVFADEVTYPMHILLRYEIEKAIFSGDVAAKDIPKIWDEKMKKYLGIDTVGNFKDGCMQDVHWPEALFGYFPSYTMGAMFAAQMAETMLEKSPSLKKSWAEGDFKDTRSWLIENVWSKGCLYETQELVKSATGSTLGAKPLLRYLKEKIG